MGHSDKGINIKAAKRVIAASQAWRKSGENRQTTKALKALNLFRKIRVNA